MFGYKPTIYMPKVSVCIAEHSTQSALLTIVQPGSKDYYKVELEIESIRNLVSYTMPLASANPVQ